MSRSSRGKTKRARSIPSTRMAMDESSGSRMAATKSPAHRTVHTRWDFVRLVSGGRGAHHG